MDNYPSIYLLWMDVISVFLVIVSIKKYQTRGSYFCKYFLPRPSVRGLLRKRMQSQLYGTILE